MTQEAVGLALGLKRASARSSINQTESRLLRKLRDEHPQLRGAHGG